MKFAIISDIHFGAEKESKGIIRKLSRHSEKLLNEFIEKMNSETKPDFVVNLGDAINDEALDIDIENLRIVLNSFKKISSPVFNLVGNHERGIEEEKLKEILNLNSFYYSVDVKNYHIIVLFAKWFSETPANIDDNQKRWLMGDLKRTNKQTLVFVHYPLDNQDLNGNFHFEGKPERALIGNREEIRDIIEKSKKVLAVFSGHVHWNNMQVINNIPYFTITSLVDNFRNDGTPSGAYSIVNIRDNSIQVDIMGEDRQKYSYEFK